MFSVTGAPAIQLAKRSLPLPVLTAVTVEHAGRADGKSKCTLSKLIQLNFELVVSCSIVPLQAYSLIGMGMSLLSLACVVFACHDIGCRGLAALLFWGDRSY